LIIIFDILIVIRDSDSQMLQVREWLCMFLVAGAMLATGNVCAQNTQTPPAEDQYERLGDSPLDQDIDLDLTVPVRETAGSPKPPESKVLDQPQQVAGHLARAAEALRAGRVDQPADDCAWFHYRAVLDIDPENPEAQQGLLEVQQVMLASVVATARELDFEMAERMLEEASLVRESPKLIEEARETIDAIRIQHAEELEIAAVSAMDAGNFAKAERALIELIALGDSGQLVNQLRRRLEEARVYGGFKPGQIIRDHFINQPLWTPETVVVLAGSFQMGSSAFEDGRTENEGPRHRVTFLRGYAIGRTEVTVKEFRKFVEKTGYKTDAEKHGNSMVYNHHSGRLTEQDDVNWRMNYEGGEALDDEPVIHVSWNDAMAFVQWLARGTGKPYRLPSESEFEYALRAGSTTRYWWGDGSPPKPMENLTGEHDVSRGRRQWSSFFEGYGDDFWGPAPVASYGSNPFGVHDIGGNVAEWVWDCWHDTYLRAPIDGSAWINPGCKLMVVRGGIWAGSPDQARSAFRLASSPNRRDARVGFRVARDL
jgi:formylglycine-generating enzyme required for sulfatase activity